MKAKRPVPTDRPISHFPFQYPFRGWHTDPIPIPIFFPMKIALDPVPISETKKIGRAVGTGRNADKVFYQHHFLTLGGFYVIIWADSGTQNKNICVKLVPTSNATIQTNRPNTKKDLELKRPRGPATLFL